MDGDLASIYVTAPDEATAVRLARALLERRLVACANVLPARSLYWWEGRIEEAPETVMFLKTRRALTDAVAAAVRELHPYDLPCVVGFPIERASPAYAAWVRSETRELR